MPYTSTSQINIKNERILKRRYKKTQSTVYLNLNSLKNNKNQINEYFIVVINIYNEEIKNIYLFGFNLFVLLQSQSHQIL